MQGERGGGAHFQQRIPGPIQSLNKKKKNHDVTRLHRSYAAYVTNHGAAAAVEEMAAAAAIGCTAVSLRRACLSERPRACVINFIKLTSSAAAR